MLQQAVLKLSFMRASGEKKLLKGVKRIEIHDEINQDKQKHILALLRFVTLRGYC